MVASQGEGHPEAHTGTKWRDMIFPGHRSPEADFTSQLLPQMSQLPKDATGRESLLLPETSFPRRPLAADLSSSSHSAIFVHTLK